jgi:hypothetical protein
MKVNCRVLFLVTVLFVAFTCSAGVFNQITLMGEYLSPAGHPGVPYSGTSSSWTVWHEAEEVESFVADFEGNLYPITTFVHKLYLNDGVQTHLLDQGGSIPLFSGDPPFGQIVLDGERVLWESESIGVNLNVYSSGQTVSYNMGIDLMAKDRYQYAFGPDYFVVFQQYTGYRGLDILCTDTMEWRHEDIQLSQFFPEDISVIGYGRYYAMQVYQNGIELRQSRCYPSMGDLTWYTERFWMEIPEPMTLGLMGLGLVLVRRRRCFKYSVLNGMEAKQ